MPYVILFVIPNPYSGSVNLFSHQAVVCVCVSWFEQLALRNGSTRYSLCEGIWVKRSIFVWLKFAGVLVSHKQIVSAVADKLHEDHLLIWSKERETIWCFHKKKESGDGRILQLVNRGSVSCPCGRRCITFMWYGLMQLVNCGFVSCPCALWQEKWALSLLDNIYLYITMCFSLHGWAIILTDCLG